MIDRRGRSLGEIGLNGCLEVGLVLEEIPPFEGQGLDAQWLS